MMSNRMIEPPFYPQWHIDHVLGEGSYGVVYKISRQDAGENFESAMKWIPLPGDETEITRMYGEGLGRSDIRQYYETLKSEFEKEIRLLYKLRGNSHIVSLEDHETVARQGDSIGYDIFIRMELLTPLEKWLAAKDKLTYGDVVRLGKDLCEALDDCAKLSIVHRDIKPDNIFVTDGDRFKLGDFGIARQVIRESLDASRRAGNLGYMSPEVFNGKPHDHRSDLYALGLVLYRTINGGRKPFEPAMPEVVTPDIAQKANDVRLGGAPLPRPVSLPDDLERLWDVIQKACEAEPENRYQSAAEMLQALTAIDTLPALARMLPGRKRSPQQSGDRPARSDQSGQRSSSDSLNKTHKRTPSSFSLDTTPGRSSGTPGQNRQDASAEKSQEVVSGEERKANKADKPSWLRPAVIAGAVFILGAVLFLVLSSSGGAGKKLDISDVTVTGVTLNGSALGSSSLLEVRDAGTVIRREQIQVFPFKVSGLVPAHSYSFTLRSGNAESSVDGITLPQSDLKDAPVIMRADLYSISRKKLEDAPLHEIKSSYFTAIRDRVLNLRSGPISAQKDSVTLWVLFDKLSVDRKMELVMALTVPGGAVFSREAMLNLKTSDVLTTYRVSLDDLLGDVFSSSQSWPEEECSLRLYLEGMPVYETKVEIKGIAE